jgi:diketogulonate reductase-like aldo/keto reductase
LTRLRAIVYDEAIPMSGDVSRRAVLRAGALALGALAMPGHARGGELLERRIPRGNESLPVVGLGTWQVFDVAGDTVRLGQARDTLRAFADGGGRVVDSSPMYGSSESVTGQLAGELGVAPKLWVATKVWTTGRQAGIDQMGESMRRLRVEPVDLMQVHNLVDAATHLATLREWKAAGRVSHVGVTHYHAGAHADLERAISRNDVDFVQVNFSLAEPEAEGRLLKAAADRGVAVLVNRPFAEGAMFRRVQGRPVPDWAEKAGCGSWAQFFLKWILAQPAVTCVIPGTRNPRHVADNLGAAAGPLPDAALRARMASHFRSL